MFKIITEGTAKAHVPSEERISKELPVFYNPIMGYNRDITIAVLKASGKTDMHVCLPLEGTGIRGIRMLKELPKKAIKQLIINDHDLEAAKLIKKNLELNSCTATVTNEDANLLLTQSKAFDYIDIDPFGTPNPFLNNAIAHLKRDGILGVTATDTAALCGTYPKACKRKYWAIPLRTEEMHEVGLRILIRKVQLLGTQYDRALTPLLSYSRDHYMRIFFQSKKSKTACDDIIKQHSTYKGAGPMWLGPLKDTTFCKKIESPDAFTKQLLEELETVGFYDIPALCKRHHLTSSPPFPAILAACADNNHPASRTHFAPQGIKTTMSEEKIVEVLREKVTSIEKNKESKKFLSS